MNKIVHLKVTLDPDILSLDSIKALPNVISFERLYPDDPALYTIHILDCELQHVETLFDTLVTVEGVSYVEYIEKPELRK